MSGTDVTSDTSAAAPAADTVEFKLEQSRRPLSAPYPRNPRS
jgi:hypothetical protein